jgi:signal transduction histidine kinase
LIDNAVKFTPRSGTVDIDVRSVGDKACIEVDDTGQGISASFLPHLFQPFRQADGTLGKRHEGLGLGLAITRQLVELHGGTIKATSGGEGQGARFIIMLPKTEYPSI